MTFKHDMFGSSDSNQVENNTLKPTLKSLIELGCIKRSVEIDGINFTLRSLNATESFSAKKFLDANEMSDEEKLFQLREFILAISIESVNGESLESFFEGDQKADTFTRRRKVLAMMQPSVLDKLMDEFNSLTQEANPVIDPNIVKN